MRDLTTALRLLPVRSLGHKRSSTVVLVLVGTMGAALVGQGLPTLFPFIQEDFKLSRAQVGLIVWSIGLGATLGVLPMGWLTDRLGARRPLAFSGIGAAVGLSLFSQANFLGQALLVGLLLGVATSASVPASTKAIMDSVSPQARRLAMGIVESSPPFSGLLAASIIPSLAVTYGWGSAAWVLVILAAVSAVVFFASFRDNPHSVRQRSTRGGLIKRIPLLVRNRDIWLVTFSGTILQGLQITVVTYLILFLLEDVGMAVTVAGGMLATAFAGAGLGRIAWGAVSDVLVPGRPVLVLALVVVLSAMSLTLLSRLPTGASPIVVGGAVFLAGSTAMAWQGLYQPLLAELADQELTGTTVGFVSMVRRPLASGIPPLFGLVVDQTDSYDTGWWMMAGLACAAALVLAFLRRPSQNV